MAESSQIKLLRLLQEEEYYPIGSDTTLSSNARIIAATNADIKLKQEQRGFRKDLYYRLIAHHVHIPPLRERFEDIPFLLNRFIEEFSHSLGKSKPTIPKALYILLRTYHFPGNIRELQSMVYDAVSRHEAGILSLSFFREYLKKFQRSTETAAGVSGVYVPNISYSGEFPLLEEVVNFFISAAMKKAEGNQSIAAQLLGISQSTLSRRFKGKK